MNKAIAWKASYLTCVGQLISRRRALGWSQEKLSQRLGVSYRTAQRWENGESSPTAPELFWWASVLNISITSIMACSDAGAE